MTFPLKTIGILKSKGADTDNFKTTINTALGIGASIDLRTILVDGYNHDFTVYWDDGNSYAYSGTTPSTDANLNHSYSGDGTYQLTFSKNTLSVPKIGGWSVNNGSERFKFISVDQWGANLFDYLSFGFYGCSNLTSLASDGIKGTSSLVSLGTAFRDTGLLSVPQNLLHSLTHLTSINSIFRGSNGISEIPTTFLQYCINLVDASLAFQSMGSLLIYSDLFQYNTLIQLFTSTFAGTDVNVPEDLFYYNSAATNYYRTLFSSDNLVLPTRIFNLANLSIVTTFEDFMRASSTSVSGTGTIQDIWNYALSATHDNAFLNQIDLDNFCEIPNDWKGFGDSFIMSIDTSLGTGTTFTLPLISGATYGMCVEWESGVYDYISAYNQTEITHDYGVAYSGQVKISGVCTSLKFDNAGDKLKVTSIDQWGSVGFGLSNSVNFYGCSNNSSIVAGDFLENITRQDALFRDNNLTSLPSGVLMDSLITGIAIFYGNSLTALPSSMTLSNLTNGNSMFYNNSLTALPSGMLMNNLITGSSMFFGNNLTALPTSMSLNSMTTAPSMFSGNSLSILPTGMLLTSLSNGDSMFLNNSLTALPSSMTLSSLTDGDVMFQNCFLSALPTGMILSSLTTGTNMLRGNNLTGLPSGMILGSLLSGAGMFEGNSLTTVPSVMTLASLTNGTQMFENNTIDTTTYSQLINNIDANNSNTNVVFHGGNSTYNSGAQSAHDNLTSVKLWTITDGGLV